jgi:hypothetical protein
MFRHTVVAAAVLTFAAPALAENLEGSTLGAVGSSSEQDDGALMSISRIALASERGFSLFGVGMAGYAAKHRRLLTGLGAGAMLSRRYGMMKPRVGLALMLQNERSVYEALDDPLGSAFGTGEDIVRRPGAMGTAGVDIRLWKAHGLELFATAEVSVTRLFDDGGPSHYVAAGAGFGARIEFSLGRQGLTDPDDDH